MGSERKGKEGCRSFGLDFWGDEKTRVRAGRWTADGDWVLGDETMTGEMYCKERGEDATLLAAMERRFVGLTLADGSFACVLLDRLVSLEFWILSRGGSS